MIKISKIILCSQISLLLHSAGFSAVQDQRHQKPPLQGVSSFISIVGCILCWLSVILPSHLTTLIIRDLNDSLQLLRNCSKIPVSLQYNDFKIQILFLVTNIDISYVSQNVYFQIWTCSSMILSIKFWLLYLFSIESHKMLWHVLCIL